MSDNQPNSTDKSPKPGLKPSQLSDLYPKPKTYEDRQQDKIDRETRRLNRIPKHVSLVISVRLFIITALLSLLITVAPRLIGYTHSEVFAGVFTIFLLVFTLLGIIKWQSSEVSKTLYKIGINPSSFLLLYSVTLAPLFVVLLYQVNTLAPVLLLLVYVLLFAAHIFCIHLIIRALTR